MFFFLQNETNNVIVVYCALVILVVKILYKPWDNFLF